MDLRDENARQIMTTKHDKARLLHLRVDHGASADWTSALREKSIVSYYCKFFKGKGFLSFVCLFRFVLKYYYRML